MIKDEKHPGSHCLNEGHGSKNLLDAQDQAHAQLEIAKKTEIDSKTFLESLHSINTSTNDSIVNAQNIVSHAVNNRIFAENNINSIQIQIEAMHLVKNINTSLGDEETQISQKKNFSQLIFGVATLVSLILIGGIFFIVRKISSHQSREAQVQLKKDVVLPEENVVQTKKANPVPKKEPVIILASSQAKRLQENQKRKSAQ